MLSPIPLNPADYGVVPPSPGQIAGSPLKWPFQSPGLGRTPGAYVVQEGRLSLEVFDFDQAHLESPKMNQSIDLLAQIDGAAPAKASAAALQRASSTAQLDLFAPHNQNAAHKSDNSVIYNASAELVASKASVASKMLKELPEKLTAQMKDTVADAKASLGLKNFDSNAIENRLQAALQSNPSHPSDLSPRSAFRSYPQAHNSTHHTTNMTNQGPTHQSNVQQHQQQQPLNLRPQRKRGRFAYHEDHQQFEDEGELADFLPPKKRLAHINKLSQELRDIEQRNSKLCAALNQAESRLNSETTDNQTLWAMIAHIGAAIHAAVEERKEEANTLAAAIAAVQQENDNKNNITVTTDTMHATATTAATVNINTTSRIETGIAAETKLNDPVSAIDNANPLSNTHLHPPSTDIKQQQQETTIGQALFSPNGDDLLAACGMFSSPLHTLPNMNTMNTTTSTRAQKRKSILGGGEGGSEKPRQLFNNNNNGKKKMKENCIDEEERRKSFSFKPL